MSDFYTTNELVELLETTPEVFETKEIWEKIEDTEANTILFCKHGPDHALRYAMLKHDQPHDGLREASSDGAIGALHYAILIDKQPHHVTRMGACRLPYTAYLYASCVDKQPRQEVEEAIKRSGISRIEEMYKSWKDSLA